MKNQIWCSTNGIVYRLWPLMKIVFTGPQAIIFFLLKNQVYTSRKEGNGYSLGNDPSHNFLLSVEALGCK